MSVSYTHLEEADIINRFEIRLRNERAYYAVRDLLTYYDAEPVSYTHLDVYKRQNLYRCRCGLVCKGRGYCVEE